MTMEQVSSPKLVRCKQQPLNYDFHQLTNYLDNRSKYISKHINKAILEL